MSIILNHTIVPAHDKIESAQFLAQILDRPFKGVQGHFAPVSLSDDLTLDFDTHASYDRRHYALAADGLTFDEIGKRVEKAGIKIGSSPEAGWDGQLYHQDGNKGFYFQDPAGHSIEVFTSAESELGGSLRLDHTIIPATNKVAAAEFLANILGLKYEGESGPFAPLQINDSLTLDFDDSDGPIHSHHLAFLISEADFDAVLQRLRSGGLTYGSDPFAQDNLRINHRLGGRGLYFKDPNGHSWEVMTRT